MDAAQRTLDRWIFAWCALTQKARRWQTTLEDCLRKRGLTAGELLILWRTGQATPPGISQIDLARELAISAAQVCGVVETLQSRGWLQMARPKQDRRRLFCSLTLEGEALLAQLVEDLSPMAEQMLRESKSSSILEDAA